MKPFAASITLALALSGPLILAQENVLRPFRPGDPPEVRRAEPVRRAQPAARTPVPVATPIPVGRPVPATPVPFPAPPAATPAAATPKPVPKATPAPLPDLTDPAGEIRVSPVQTPMAPDQVQLSVADSYFAKGMFDMAAPEYEKYLGLYANGAERATALFRVGECYRRTGSFNAAKTSYQTLLDQYAAGDFIGAAAYRLGEIYYSEKNYAASLPFYRRASVRLKDPRLANAAKFFTGRCLEAQGQRLDARLVYEDLVATPQNNPFLDNSRLSYAQLLRTDGRTAEAQKQVSALAQLAENPDLKAQATVLSGAWLIDLGQNAKAEDTLKKALAMPGIERWRDVARMGLVQLAFNGEKHQEVIDTWIKNTADFGPETLPQIMTLAAKSYSALGKTSEAMALFTEVAQKFPGSSFAKDAGYERLKVLYKANDPSVVKEIDDYVAAGTEEGKRDLIFLMKAEVLFKRNEFSAAAPLYDYATKSRQLVGNQKAEALGKLAWCYQQTRELDRAVKALTDLIDAFPTYKGMASAILQRAVSQLRLNNTDGAVKDFRRLIEQYPKAKEREAAILQLGRMLGQKGDNAGMAAIFRIYLKDYPEAPEPERAEANFWLGGVAFDNKAYKDAIEPLSAALKLNKSEYFERVSFKLMLCRYYLEDTAGLAKEIDAYMSGDAKGQVPYQVLSWLGATLFERARAEESAGQLERAVDDYKGALKYLGILMKREDAKAGEWGPLGRSALAIKDFGTAESAFSSLLKSIKEPAPRAEAFNDLAQSQLGLGKYPVAQSSVEEGLKLQPDGPINAKLKVTAGDIQAAQQKWLDAARMYESVTAIIDDEDITPRAGEKAVEAYRKAGEEETAKKLLNKLQSRYPEYFQNKRKKP